MGQGDPSGQHQAGLRSDAPLLSHAAKIPRTESYHSDRSEVGFGLGYRAIYQLAQGAGSRPAGRRPCAIDQIPKRDRRMASPLSSAQQPMDQVF